MSDDFSQFQLGRKANSTNDFSLSTPETVNAFEQVGNNTLVKNNPLQSPNYVSGQTGYTLNPDGTAEFRNVTASGSITADSVSATSGTIGGFTIGATTLSATNLSLDSSGQRISLGSGNDIIILDADDATYRMWVGDATTTSAPFKVSKAGAVTASSITLTTSGALLEGTVIVNAPLTVSFTAGEAITANDSVSISDGTLQYTNISVAGNTNRLIFGTGTDASDEGQRILQSFQLSQALSVKVVTISLDKVGAPGDNVQVTIQGDSSGAPDGTPIGSTVTVAAAAVSGSLGDVDFTFATPAALSASTTYWLVIERTGASSAVSYYRCDANNGGNPYANGLAKIRKYGGTTDNAFSNTTSDIRFVIKTLVTAGQVARASALANDARTKNFIGFAKSTVSLGSSVEVVIAGLATLAGLSAGSLYYMSDTNGAIATSAGSTTRKVGIAVSTTQLLITNNW